MYIFGKGHFSTLGASRDAVFLILLSATEYIIQNQKNCVSRRSQSQKMTLSKDKFDAVRRNPYSIIVHVYSIHVKHIYKTNSII